MEISATELLAAMTKNAQVGKQMAEPTHDFAAVWTKTLGSGDAEKTENPDSMRTAAAKHMSQRGRKRPDEMGTEEAQAGMASTAVSPESRQDQAAGETGDGTAICEISSGAGVPGEQMEAQMLAQSPLSDTGQAVASGQAVPASAPTAAETVIAGIMDQLAQTDAQLHQQLEPDLPAGASTQLPTVQADGAEDNLSQVSAMPQGASALEMTAGAETTTKAALATETGTTAKTRNPGIPEAAAQASDSTLPAVENTLKSATDAQAFDSQTPGNLTGDAQGESVKMEKARHETKTAATATPFSTALASQSDWREENLTELSAAVDRALTQFETDLQGFATDGSSIRIDLQPKEFGSVSITLAASANGVSAKIRTDTPEAASLIADQTQRLILAMQAKGVKVENVQVIYNGLTQQSMENSSGGGHYEQSSSRNDTAPLFSTSSGEYESALSSYENMTETYAVESGAMHRIECTA